MESIQTIKQAVSGARQVCLFGIGALLNECYDQLVLSLGREPDIFCDNAPDKWGQEFIGKRCISPSELAAQSDGMVVIITVRKHEEIYSQLFKLGIRDIFAASFDSGYYTLRGIIRTNDDYRPARKEESCSIDVHGKWTLVTGASRGVGRQIALAMAGLGSNIIAHGRSVSHVADVVHACSEYGVQVVPVAADFGNLAEVEAMLTHLEHLAPQIDIVFNNAAIASHWTSDIWSVDSSKFSDCFTVNAIVPALISQRLVPPMIQRGFGRVVNLHTNLRHVPQEIPYVCSKAALDKYVYDMAPSLQGTGVMLTLADPGWVRTDAGGPSATHAVESVIPGILLGALVNADINGCRFSAQEYAGLSIEAAARRAQRRLRELRSTWV
jgi:3-oxoacyl-[acyl-carrier protein] reductase